VSAPSRGVTSACAAALAFACGIFAATATAQDASIRLRRQTETPLSNVGIALGERIPAFTALDQDGHEQTFESIRGPNGAVIYFHRSASWCIYCRAQLVETERAREGLARNGLGLVAVSYDSPDTLREFATEKGIHFSLLSDPNSQIIRDFQILDATVLPGNPAFGVPYHGNYIVDHDGVVVAKLFDAEATLAHTTGVVVQRLFGSPVNTHEKTVTHERLELSYFASANEAGPGDVIDLTIEVRLEDGIHVYAPTSRNRIPVALNLTASESFVAEETAFPPAETITDAVLGESSDVYAGQFTLTRRVRMTADAFDRPGAVDPQGNVVIAGSFDFQACDDHICYNPKSIALKWPLSRMQSREVQGGHPAHHH
jgi:peroxiredoxin